MEQFLIPDHQIISVMLNNFSHYLNIFITRLHIIWGRRNYMYANWWGIVIGKRTRFDGKCYFKRYPGTTIKIGDNCFFQSRVNSNPIGINRPCYISTFKSDSNANITIGNNCGFSGTTIGAFKSIIIGNEVKCGANTLITDGDWHLEDERSGEPKQVILHNNVWLGEGVKVLKGVTIGENSVIGAGSVVTKSIPANVVAAGNPCKIIKTINH